jgi:hypothetical protein
MHLQAIEQQQQQPHEGTDLNVWDHQHMQGALTSISISIISARNRCAHADFCLVLLSTVMC